MRIISPSPHLHSGASTPSIMRDVFIALAPAFLFSIFVYGPEALWVTAVSVGACVLFEWAITRFLLNRPSTVGDWSAVLTGILLAFNLPPSVPLWIVVIGAFVAIAIAKMSFGGLGRNLFNPALVGRVFLLVSFPVQMTTFPTTAAAMATDAVSGATPLALIKEALKKGESLSSLMPNIDLSNMLFGFKDGSLGEISALLLILGGVYLLIRRVITWHIPVYVLGTMALFAGICHLAAPEHYATPLFHLLAGGALLGAIFMATDYVTSPMSRHGMLIYGIGIGAITMLIRLWGAYPEGMSFAILIMNAAVPLINMYAKPSRFGTVKVAKIKPAKNQ